MSLFEREGIIGSLAQKWSYDSSSEDYCSSGNEKEASSSSSSSFESAGGSYERSTDGDFDDETHAADTGIYLEEEYYPFQSDSYCRSPTTGVNQVRNNVTTTTTTTTSLSSSPLPGVSVRKRRIKKELCNDTPEKKGTKEHNHIGVSSRRGGGVSINRRLHHQTSSSSSGSPNLLDKLKRQQRRFFRQSSISRIHSGNHNNNCNKSNDNINNCGKGGRRKKKKGYLSRLSSILLLGSIFVWCYARYRHHRRHKHKNNTMRKEPFNLEDKEGMEANLKRRARKTKQQLEKKGGDNTRESGASYAGELVHDVVDGVVNFFGLKKRRHSSVNNVEKLPEHCVRPQWQSRAFINCNDVHAIDLRQVEIWANQQNSALQTKNKRKIGYLASGLWRSVWLINPSDAPSFTNNGINGSVATTHNNNAVLKIMKPEHTVDSRNFERHRRDALVMERLTSSNNVVDIYGYCGNTVLSEYAGDDLDDIIYKNGRDTKMATRKTSDGRLKLALDVAKGMAALHEISGGPIIHADIQAKQFLVDSHGTVKINDFNRCRFMATHNHTEESCKLRIPSSPGKNRSPEEYADKDLDEKLDIYSTANILYGILTGKKAREEISVRATKIKIKAGDKPIVDTATIPDLADTDTELIQLMNRAYELDPKERISASALVHALSEVVEQQTKSQIP